MAVTPVFYIGFGSGGGGGGGVAPTIIQSISDITAVDTGNIQLAYTNPVVAGNLLVVCAWGRNGGGDGLYTAGMLTQSSGTATVGTIALDAATANLNPSTNSAPAAIWSAPVPALSGGTCTFQMSMVSWTGATTRTMWMIFEVGLVDISGTRLNAAITASQDSTTAVSSGNVATGGAGIIFGVFGCVDPPANTITPDAAFTVGVNNQNSSFDDGCIMYRPVTTNTTDSADFACSAAVYAAVCAAAYKAATP